MSRLPSITQPEQLAPDQRKHYDSILRSRKHIGPPYGELLHCPDLAARTAHLLGYALFTTDFPAREKELVICTVARELDCLFEWAAHAEAALEAGVRAEAVAAIRDGKAPQGLTDAEAPFVRYVQQLLRPPHRIAGPVFEELRHRLGDVRLAELTGIIGAYTGLACSLNAFAVEAPEGAPVLPLSGSNLAL